MNTNNGWLDIASAPKDGTEFLVRYGRQGGVVEIAKWNTIHGYFVSKGDPLLGFYTNVTEWAPLPPFVATPPASAQDDAKDDGLAEAQRLAQALFQRHFAQDDDYANGRVKWEVLDDLPGVLSQIDNMVSGLVQPAAPAAGDARDAERYRCIRNPPYSDRYGDLYAMTFQGDGDIPLKGEALDAATDRAIAASQQQEG